MILAVNFLFRVYLTFLTLLSFNQNLMVITTFKVIYTTNLMTSTITIKVVINNIIKEEVSKVMDQ
jgi:hypothetical protein